MDSNNATGFPIGDRLGRADSVRPTPQVRTTSPPSWPKNRKAAVKLANERRGKKAARKKARAERQRTLRGEARRQEAEDRSATAKTIAHEKRNRIENNVAVYRAAVAIQSAWRTPKLRKQYQRARYVRLSAQQRLVWGANMIGKAWLGSAKKSMLAYAKARLNEIMAPHRLKVAQLPRSRAFSAVAVEAEGTKLKEAPEESIVRGAEAAINEESTTSAPGLTAAPSATVSSSTLSSKQSVDNEILLNKIRSFQKRQAEEIKMNAAAEARMNAEAAKTARQQEVQRRAELEAKIKEKVTEVLRQRQEQTMAREAAAREEATVRDKEARMDQIRPLLHLPPSRKHVEGKPEELVPYPLQLLEGKMLLYSPKEFNLSELLGHIQGWSLSLGVAPVWDGGVARGGEEFAVVCGFSAAFGPLLLDNATETVFGKTFFNGVDTLLPEHVAYMMRTFWKNEVEPHDTAERFFRLVGKGSQGHINREQLRPFILEVAHRHPELNMLSVDDAFQYVDTVLAIMFSKHGRNGVIGLREARRSGLVACINAVGRQERPLEGSEYFSWARHERICGDYWSLCGPNWTVGQESLTRYRQGGDGRAVGSFRAKRVLEVGVRPFSVTVGGTGEYARSLPYDGWVCFYLCEEAMRAGRYSARDVQYCFAVVDEACEGRIGINDVTPFCNRMEEAQNDGFPTVEEFVHEYSDAMGVQRGRGHITLAEMLEPGNVAVAGRFFQELFAETVLSVGDGDGR